MRRVLISSFLVFLLSPALIFAQRDSLRRIFLDAESWFLFEEYAEALPLYETLLESDPGNDNLNYKIGICLLNDPYQKDRAIQYLLRASNNINPDYKQSSMKERGAPPDALYYLGSAYLVNELLDRAIESYEEFLEIMDHAIYDEELVLAQIRSCRNAKRLKTMPVDIDLRLIDSLINTRYPDVRPVVSGDGTKMAFVTELPFYDGAFYSELRDDGWSYPQIITQMLGFDADVYPVALSYDGTEMILYYDDDYIGNLYYSHMEDGLWTPATKLGENISTKYWESHASFSKDGQTLYFTSNRKGTHGGLDIYLSEKQADGKWGPSVNLGSTINTRYNEESPYISEDGKTLYFSSYGHYNMGGYDIFYSRKNANGSWAEPVNIGYPINTTDDDLYFQPTDNGHAAYYSIYSPKGIGEHDIYYMNIYSVNNPRYYVVSGRLRTKRGSDDVSGTSIYVIDTNSGDTIVYSVPGKEGTFALKLKQGMYELHFTGEGYEELIRPLQITRESHKQGINLEDDLVLALEEEGGHLAEEAEVFEGEESQVKFRETQVEEAAGTALTVPLIAPKGSVIVIRAYQDSVLLSTDTLVTERRRTQLEILALEGNSEVEVEFTDEDGNIHRNRLLVVGTVAEIPDAKNLEMEDRETEGQELQERVAEDQDIKDRESEYGVEPEDRPIDQGPVVLVEPGIEDPVGILLYEMQKGSEGSLQSFLLDLHPEEEDIESQEELISFLYEQAGTRAYSEEDVDLLLAETISGGDVELLRAKLTENSGVSLKDYLLALDLGSTGISSTDELIKHLLEVADGEDFTMEEVRNAMQAGLDQGDGSKALLTLLQIKSQGTLRNELISLESTDRGLSTGQELFEYLYEQSIQGSYKPAEVDILLAELLSDGDAPMLLEYMLENSEGELRAFLDHLDLEAEGIRSTEELLKYLEGASKTEGFTMDEVRTAMLGSLGEPLEVYELYKEALQLSEGSIREILESMNLRGLEIYTVEQLMKHLDNELENKGLSKKERAQILSRLFGERYADSLGGKNKTKWPLVVVLAVAGAGLIIFVLARWKRRKKEDEQGA